MQDPRVAKMADVIINYSIGLQPGEKLLIQGKVGGAPLIRELYRAALRAGGLVTTNVSLPGLEKIFYDEANEEQLRWIQPLVNVLLEEYDAYVTLWADENTKEGTQFDPQKRAIRLEANKEVQQRFIQRMAEGKLRWCGTLFPTAAHAQDAEMSVESYEDFVFNACLPDPDDPIGFWRRMEARQDRLVQFLNQVEYVRLVAKDTDLTVRTGGRRWVNACGHKNFPDGEVFTGPHEDATEGTVRFTYPAVYMGTEVEDVRLWFEGGRVVKATAGKGEAFLKHMLDSDEGAKRLGEFAIGTNPGITRFTRHTLFDEKIQGTVHMALGFSIPESGGVNQSKIHWDMVCDLREGGQIYADDRLIYENGRFVIDFE
ncbi:MAG: aminopeptidase [Caldilineae bacterium]|nr:MAG: aminopeptidase [Caldilineae bacterium]